MTSAPVFSSWDGTNDRANGSKRLKSRAHCLATPIPLDTLVVCLDDCLDAADVFGPGSNNSDFNVWFRFVLCDGVRQGQNESVSVRPVIQPDPASDQITRPNLPLARERMPFTWTAFYHAISDPELSRVRTEFDPV